VLVTHSTRILLLLHSTIIHLVMLRLRHTDAPGAYAPGAERPERGRLAIPARRPPSAGAGASPPVLVLLPAPRPGRRSSGGARLPPSKRSTPTPPCGINPPPCGMVELGGAARVSAPRGGPPDWSGVGRLQRARRASSREEEGAELDSFSTLPDCPPGAPGALQS